MRFSRSRNNKKWRKEREGMEATKQNVHIADQILTIFAKENCTVLQTAEILNYVAAQIRARSKVQFNEGELILGVDTID